MDPAHDSNLHDDTINILMDGYEIVKYRKYYRIVKIDFYHQEVPEDYEKDPIETYYTPLNETGYQSYESAMKYLAGYVGRNGPYKTVKAGLMAYRYAHGIYQ